jgi:integrase
MVRLDLEAAGIPYVDERGLVYDFHALRHQFISNLARAGVHPKEAQDLARHSTITLTMDHYTHLDLRDQLAALDKLPGLPSEPVSEASDQAKPHIRKKSHAG